MWERVRHSVHIDDHCLGVSGIPLVRANGGMLCREMMHDRFRFPQRNAKSCIHGDVDDDVVLGVEAGLNRSMVSHAAFVVE